MIPVTVDTAAVLIEPRFTILERRDLECFAGPALLDTLVQVPGLAVATPRTFTMRATAPLLPGEIATPESPPLHRHDFGTLTVLIDSADTALRDAAGLAAFFTDSLGCQRVAPFQVYSASSHGYVSPGSYPLGNPDSTIPSYVRYFVTGAVRRAPASMCGDTLLFDLTSH